MFYLICSVYYQSKLLQKRPLKCDVSDTLANLYSRMEIDDTYYLLPPNYSRDESSGVAISPDGISRWVPAGPEDTVEMCNHLSMKYAQFKVDKMEQQQAQSQERVLTVADVLMKSSRDQAQKRKEEEEIRRRPQLPKKFSPPKHKKDELYNLNF